MIVLYIICNNLSEDVSVLFVGFRDQQCPVTLPNLSDGSIQVWLPDVSKTILFFVSFLESGLFTVPLELIWDIVEIVPFLKSIASASGFEAVDLPDDLEGLAVVAMNH